MDIDWSKAPEGATHYLPKQPDLGWMACWYKKDGNTWHVLNAQDFDDGRVRWYIDDEEVDQFVPRLITKPEPTPWDGEGLPPVGTMCEANNGGASDYFKCVVVGTHYKTGMPIIDSVNSTTGNLTHAPDCWKFRPLRTPEQIAAEERGREVNRMVATVQMLDKSWARKVCYSLYDHGYRKQENIDAKG